MQNLLRSVLLLKYITSTTVLLDSVRSSSVGTGEREGRLAYPHVAYLGNMEAGVHCQGSVLTDRIILTAALCLHGAKNASDIFVIVGEKGLGQEYERIQVSFWVRHQDYSQHNLENNIALLLLGTRLRLSDHVKKVLMSDVVARAGIVGYVAGYAITKVQPSGSSISLTFQAIREQIQSNETCRTVFPFMKRNEFCTDFHDNTQVFRGEPGSALVVEGHKQIGILSYAIEKTRKSAFSVFNQIHPYRKWIEHNVMRLQDIECRQNLFSDEHNEESRE